MNHRSDAPCGDAPSARELEIEDAEKEAEKRLSDNPRFVRLTKLLYGKNWARNWDRFPSLHLEHADMVTEEIEEMQYERDEDETLNSSYLW